MWAVQPDSPCARGMAAAVRPLSSPFATPWFVGQSLLSWAQAARWNPVMRLALSRGLRLTISTDQADLSHEIFASAAHTVMGDPVVPGTHLADGRVEGRFRSASGR